MICLFVCAEKRPLKIMSSEDAGKFGFWYKDASSNYAVLYVYAPKHVIAKASDASYKPIYFEEARKFGPHVVGIFEKKMVY